jgi:hypothetical protein
MLQALMCVIWPEAVKARATPRVGRSAATRRTTLARSISRMGLVYER